MNALGTAQNVGAKKRQNTYALFVWRQIEYIVLLSTITLEDPHLYCLADPLTSFPQATEYMDANPQQRSRLCSKTVTAS